MEFTFDNNIPIYIQLVEYMKIYLMSGVFINDRIYSNDTFNKFFSKKEFNKGVDVE